RSVRKNFVSKTADFGCAPLRGGGGALGPPLHIYKFWRRSFFFIRSTEHTNKIDQATMYPPPALPNSSTTELVVTTVQEVFLDDFTVILTTFCLLILTIVVRIVF